MKYSLVPQLIIAVIVFVGPTEGIEERNASDLSVALVVGKDKSGIPTVNCEGKFQVVFTNQSKKSICLWNEGCEYGYNTLTFRFDDGSSSPSLMCKPTLPLSEWKYRPAKTIAIPGGETLLWDVSPAACFGVPTPNTGKLVTLTAIFEIKVSEAGKQHGIWTGRITSEPIKVLVVNARLHTPHDYLWAGYAEQALKMIQADPKWITKRDDMQQTPLHIAARFGFVQVARWLLAHDADVNARAYNQFTPLHAAEDPEIVKLLLEFKADINAKGSSGQTALEKAAGKYAHLRQMPDYVSESKKWRIITRMLLDAGAEYDIRSACYLDDVERIRVLVADKKLAKDKWAMLEAAAYGQVKIVKVLLEHGADPENAGYGGLTVSFFGIQHADVPQAAVRRRRQSQGQGRISR